MKKIYLLLVLAILMGGCTKYIIKPVKDDGKYKEYFTARLQLFNNPNPGAHALPKKHRKNAQAIGFILHIKNNTEENLEIDWNKTLFFNKEYTDGSFLLGSGLCADKDSAKINDIIFAHGTFSKRIYPSHLIIGTKNGGCESRLMGIGKLGVFLSLKYKNQELQKKLFVEVVKEEN